MFYACSMTRQTVVGKNFPNSKVFPEESPRQNCPKIADKTVPEKKSPGQNSPKLQFIPRQNIPGLNSPKIADKTVRDKTVTEETFPNSQMFPEKTVLDKIVPR